MKGSIFLLKCYCFLFSCAGTSLLHAGFSPVAASGGYSRCVGFSLQQLLLLWNTGSRVRGLSTCCSLAPEHRFNSCGAWVYLIRGIWNLPRPGIEPMSPALAGRFSITGPPGKSQFYSLCELNHMKLSLFVG